MKDFDKWNEIKKKTARNIKLIVFREGEIRWCKFGINVGDEVRGKGKTFNRPVLIVKKFSKNTFLGIPITTRKRKGSWYFYIKDSDRTLVLNQVRLLDRRRLEEKISEISERKLNHIKDELCNLIKS